MASAARGTVNGRDLNQGRRLERGLIALRWLVVVFGVVQTALVLRDDVDSPGYAGPLGFSLVAALAVGNLLISMLADRAHDERQLHRVGMWAFLLDIVIVNGLIWATAEPGNSVWAVAYILPLEGAVRFGLAGAIAPVVATLVSELLRESALSRAFLGQDYSTSAVAVRVGIQLVVGVVAGLMARSLQREAEKAGERARVAEEAAARAESAAQREAQARRELAALHTAILTGVAAEDIEEGLQSMADAVAHELQCDAFAVLLLDPDERALPVLIARGVHGDPGYQRGARFAADTPLGEISATGRPVLHADPPEGIVPLRVGDESIGLLHERAAPGGSIDRERLLMLGRLADQIALVAQAARLRARREEMLRRLQELDEMKSDFVAITSHELRTPLAAIRGFVNTLRRRMPELSPAEMHEFLGIVDSQTDRLIRLVEDLLVVSRIEAGKLSLRAEEVELATFLDQTVRGIGESASRVIAWKEPGLPDTMTVDAQRLSQVLTNLLDNALKFSSADAPVEVRVSPDGPDQVSFAVIDRGSGIPRAEFDRIFDRFHQADPAGTRRSEGAGLGLYITKQLVTAMGGSVEVESEEGRGSTFTVTIPVFPLPRARVPLFGSARAD
jgi:signal transduction histidine kinase